MSTEVRAPQRKRVVTSCMPCYTKKQKCNRRYPCSHCTRRRRPEECTYHISTGNFLPATTLPTQRRPSTGSYHEVDGRRTQQCEVDSSDNNIHGAPEASSHSIVSSLADVFGYFEDSDSNSLALVRMITMQDDENEAKPGPNRASGRMVLIPPDTTEEVAHQLHRMPERHILDFLVQYFIAQVHWMDQMVYPPWLLGQYEDWWGLENLSSVDDLEFAVLVLRICSYSSQFLPSPSYTVDQIRGMLLGDIRNMCDEVADSIEAICLRLDARGSLVRVQYLAYAGLSVLCEGGTNAFREELSRVITVAHNVGIHSDIGVAHFTNELEKEMRRRTFCNLFIWDSQLARNLDQVPYLPKDSFGDENVPRMQLNADGGPKGSANAEPEAPELFTERLLQARLSSFWRRVSPRKGSAYEGTEAERRYEQFCSEFLTGLPPPFALQPIKIWDERLVKLAMQRQLLHINIFESLCANFRPVLVQKRHYVLSLPRYKQVLLSSQRRALAVAALQVLQCVATLYELMGASHTRCANIIIPSFEAAVVLVCLGSDMGSPVFEAGHYTANAAEPDPLKAEMADVTAPKCLKAVQEALERLQTLAEVSGMAEMGAKTLARLMARISTGRPSADELGDNKGGASTTNDFSLIPEPGNSIESSWAPVGPGVEQAGIGDLGGGGAITEWDALMAFQSSGSLGWINGEGHAWAQ